MKILIKSIYGSLLFEGDFSSLADAVTEAVKQRANLKFANLEFANLGSANLKFANLEFANLEFANLGSANLKFANLEFANLGSANLGSANLGSANLKFANLESANLKSANLKSAKADYFDVLLRGKKEIDGLRLAIVEGRINGSTYSGECACLVGTIANLAHVDYNDIPNLKPNPERPSERLFLAIKKGDTPETNQISKIVLEWTDEFIKLLNA